MLPARTESELVRSILHSDCEDLQKTGSTVAPGSVIGLEGAELEEMADLLELNFDGDIERIYEPYGNEISQRLTADTSARKIAILLRGVVEVQAPFQKGGASPTETPNLYPVTVLRAPAIIGLFEVIPESNIQRHHVKVLSGVQSFAVLLSLSQLQPWRQIAKRSSTTISYQELESSSAASESKHTNLFKWTKRWCRAPAFTGIAYCYSDDWSVELAILDVGPILVAAYDRLSHKQRHL